jgi:hypothetical protein
MIELGGLELAKYILLRLVVQNESIERLTQDFDNDTRFINGVVKFLQDIGWIKQNGTGGYQMSDVVSYYKKSYLDQCNQSIVKRN